jgi:hypothetical protein
MVVLSCTERMYHDSLSDLGGWWTAQPVPMYGYTAYAGMILRHYRGA